MKHGGSFFDWKEWERGALENYYSNVGFISPTVFR